MMHSHENYVAIKGEELPAVVKDSFAVVHPFGWYVFDGLPRTKKDKPIHEGCFPRLADCWKFIDKRIADAARAASEKTE